MSGAAARVIKGAALDRIDQFLDLLDRWQHLPAYQLERRADVLEPLLAFLMYHDLADISKAGDRVWLSSVAKAKLGLST